MTKWRILDFGTSIARTKTELDPSNELTIRLSLTLVKVKAMTPNNENSGNLHHHEVGTWHELQAKVASHSMESLEEWFDTRFKELEMKYKTYVTTNSVKLRGLRRKESE
jgi:hypothetical protein